MTTDCSLAGGAECSVAWGIESFVTQDVDCSVAGDTEVSVAGGTFLVGFAFCHPILLCALPHSYKWGSAVPRSISL